MAKRLRWGVLGTAGIAGGQVVPAIQASSNGRVVAVAGRDPARTAEFAATHAIARTHSGYRALLDDADIDAVYIPLPNSLHAEWAIAAAEAGKPVLCEKPLALTADEARGVVDAFARRGVPLMEGFMYRFHPQHRRVQELISDGVVGEVREVTAHLSVNLMDPTDPQNIRFDLGLGGGSLLDMGCYAVSIVRGVFGDEPQSVQGFLDIDARFGVDVSGAALLAFSDGRTGLASCSFRADGQGTYKVVGSKGTIEVPRAVIPGMGSRVAETLVVSVDADGRRRDYELAPAEQYRLMVEAFGAAIINGTPLPYSPEDAVRNLRVLDAIAAAARSGSRISLS